MLCRILITALCLLHHSHPTFCCDFEQEIVNSNDSIPFSTRAHWMRAANQALFDLDSPCPLRAFGTVIVNHTAPGLGELVCMGINRMSNTGNPTMHGEIVAIGNCSSVLTAENGKYRLTPEEALNAFSELSLYTNAEACPMCASAIRFAGFKEYIYGTSINTLISSGWQQIRIRSSCIFNSSYGLLTTTKLIAGILSNETDPLFKWQYNPDNPCPSGCQRTEPGSNCEKILE
ncbi:tRNA-specific adenosine deaminase TAD2 [Pseudolycoriella hygida]|uniref:tRNA-specific adenosine deaminase TAD2 n=1 Tax=Pseudolycoriella hygida TaxID=35572 RepID=A0A9Q0S9H2_9DIPT|nr:tRNA-specific adenosine deaminase TAD2 [Pseudolycoriella hygida]